MELRSVLLNLNLFNFMMSDVVADIFIIAKINFTNFGNVQILSDDDEQSLRQREEEHAGLHCDPGEETLHWRTSHV